jgi:uncharacterized protein
MTLLIITALSLGFLGSFHCAGMCGPIALALPVHHRSAAGRATGILIYNIGRALTYAMLGATFGLLGNGFAMAGFQQGFSISIGILMLIFALMPEDLAAKITGVKHLFRGFTKLKQLLGHLFQQRTNKALLFTGLLNGLLPCGLVYLGIAGAAATGNALHGALFMAAFGMGTFPLMIGVSAFSQLITIPVRNKIRRAMPVVIVVMGLMLILRGLNLGIPYISPEITHTEQGTEASCCKPDKHRPHH